jgi:hypothetical protein
MLQRELATGRFMMSDQPIKVAKKAYSPHNKYLKKSSASRLKKPYNPQIISRRLQRSVGAG